MARQHLEMKETIDPRVATQMRERVVNTTSLLADEDEPIKEELGENWAVDLKKRVVHWRVTNPFPPYNVLTPEELTYLVAHESGHLTDSSVFKTYQDARRESFDRFVNAYEDIRIEDIQQKRYPGFEQFKDTMTPKVESFWLDDGVLRHTEPTDQYGFLSWAYENLDEEGIAKAEKLCHPEVVKLYDDDLRKRVKALNSTQEVANELESIYEKIQEATNTVPQGGGKQGRDKDSGPQGGVSGMGQKADTALEQARSAAPNTHRGKAEASYDAKMDAHRQSTNVVQDEITARDWGSFEQNASTREEAPEPGGGTSDHGVGRYGVAYWKDEAAKVRVPINNLHRRLMSVLRANKQDVWESSHKRGRLDNRTSFRVMTGNPRVFKRKHAFGHYDYLVGLVIDVSGSMEGRKIQATRATVTIGEALDKTGIPFFMITYSDRVTAYKPSRFSLKKHGDAIASRTLFPGGGTGEYSALYGALQEFHSASPETVKIMIAITDGTTSRQELSRMHLQEMDKLGVHAFQIGLNIPPAEYYEHGIQVDDVNQLAPEIGKILKKLVKQGV